MEGQAASWLFAVFPTFILMDNCYLSTVICGMQTKSFAWSEVFSEWEKSRAFEVDESWCAYRRRYYCLWTRGVPLVHIIFIQMEKFTPLQPSYLLSNAYANGVRLIWKSMFLTRERQCAHSQTMLPWERTSEIHGSMLFRWRFLHFETWQKSRKYAFSKYWGLL